MADQENESCLYNDGMRTGKSEKVKDSICMAAAVLGNPNVKCDNCAVHNWLEDAQALNS